MPGGGTMNISKGKYSLVCVCVCVCVLWCHAQNSVEDDWFPNPVDLPRTPSPEPLPKKRHRQEADHSDEEPIASPKRHQSGFPNPLGITITRTLSPPLFGDYQVITHPQTGHLTIDYQH